MTDRRVNKMQPFSVFIPVYNEEVLITKNTAQLIDYLNTLQTAHEIIIVSNGSTDQTPELGKTLPLNNPKSNLSIWLRKALDRPFDRES